MDDQLKKHVEDATTLSTGLAAEKAQHTTAIGQTLPPDGQEIKLADVRNHVKEAMKKRHQP